VVQTDAEIVIGIPARPIPYVKRDELGAAATAGEAEAEQGSIADIAQIFGVERSIFAGMSVGAIRAAMRMVFGGRAMFRGKGASDGLPADFLVSSGGVVLAAKYGRHASDQWDVDEIRNPPVSWRAGSSA
jgi:hypothetical protein